MTVLSSEIRDLGYSMNHNTSDNRTKYRYITFTGNRGRKNYKIKLHDTRQLERQLIFVFRIALLAPLAAELRSSVLRGNYKKINTC